MTSIGRLQCAPLFDQKRPVLRPDRTAKRTGCQGWLHGRRALAGLGLDRSEYDGGRPTAASRLHWHCRIYP